MVQVNLGRVQGGGFFYSSATSGTSITKSTLSPSGLVPLVGDSVVFPNGDVRKVTSVSGDTVTCGGTVTSFKGPQGDTGEAHLQFKNVQVAANAFVADTTYDGYPFRAAITLSGVTSTMAPTVCFGVAQATSGDYAPVADSYNGGVYLYAKKTNDALFSIPFISLEVTE